MARIEQYTQGITVRRDVQRLTNPNAVNEATATMRGVAGLANTAFDIIDAHNKANETTALNDLSIESQKQKMILAEKARQEKSSNPFGFADAMEQEFSKIDQEYEKQLPSERARQAWRESVKQQNFSFYKSNYGWEQQRATQIYAERTEKAAKNISDMAYLAGRNGASIDDVMKNVGATVVSVSTYQPNQEVLKEVNGRMSKGAAISYIKGLAESDPVSAFNLLSAGQFDAKLGAQKADELKKGLAKEAASTLAYEDPDAAKQFVSSDAFRNVIGAKDAIKWQQVVDKEISRKQTIGATTQVAVGADTLLKASLGEIGITDIQEDPALSSEDRYIATGLLTGDEAAIMEFQKKAGIAEGGFEDVNSFSVISDIEAAGNALNASKKSDADYKNYITQLNSLKNLAAAARAHNKNNRGKGLTQRDFDIVMKKVGEAMTRASAGLEDNQPGWFGTPSGIDYLYSEIKSMSPDNKTRAELIGYASSIAEQKNIVLQNPIDESEAKKVLGPILNELRERRRRQLGIKISAPRTATVIKDGVKENIGGEASADAVADRNVTVPKRTLVYNAKTGNFE